jgi:UDP-glucose 4-epimerase
MLTSLVTGGAGFIGSHVVDEALRMGHRVVVLDDLSGGFAENVNPRAEFVAGSVLDHELVDQLFLRHQFDYVYHLAAYAAEGLSHFIRRFNYTNNLVGTVNLTNAALNSGRVRCFVFTSSIAVYGHNQLPMTEDAVPQPEDPYGIAKYACELDLRSQQALFGLPYVIFRPHNVYGERQNIGDRYRNVIGIFMNQAMRGEAFSVFGDGTQTRAFSHIDDVAPLIARAVEQDLEVDLVVGHVDAGGVVDEVGVERDAVERGLDAGLLGHAEVSALADDPAPQLADELRCR